MVRPTTLRVGICDCSHRYHSKLEGRELVVHGRWFKVREFVIPDHRADTVLRHRRCHFFVDLHQRHHPNLYSLIIVREKVTDDDYRMSTINYMISTLGRYWRWQRPATTLEVLRGITSILKKLQLKTLNRWLARFSRKAS